MAELFVAFATEYAANSSGSVVVVDVGCLSERIHRLFAYPAAVLLVFEEHQVLVLGKAVPLIEKVHLSFPSSSRITRGAPALLVAVFTDTRYPTIDRPSSQAVYTP